MSHRPAADERDPGRLGTLCPAADVPDELHDAVRWVARRLRQATSVAHRRIALHQHHDVCPVACVWTERMRGFIDGVDLVLAALGMGSTRGA